MFRVLNAFVLNFLNENGQGDTKHGLRTMEIQTKLEMQKFERERTRRSIARGF